MKIYKKIALLVVIFLVSTTLGVFAEASGTADVILAPSSTSLKVGETVTITVSAKCENGVEGVNTTLEYDKTKLEFTNVNEVIQETGNMSGFEGAGNNGKFKLSAVCSTTETQKETKVATLKFKVLGTATVDETLSVKLSEIEVYDSNLDTFTMEDKVVTLKVVESEEENNPGGGEQKPEEGENNPGDVEQKPEAGENNPGDVEQKPGGNKPSGGEQKPEEEAKDNTIADKPIGNAGVKTYGAISIVGTMIVTAVLYVKNKKYRDVK